MSIEMNFLEEMYNEMYNEETDEMGLPEAQADYFRSDDTEIFDNIEFTS